LENKTRGIVIRTIKYGESSAICKILTEQFGLLGFHIPGVYKNKGKVKMSYLQPLNTVELSLNYKKNSNLQRIIDITCHSYPELKSFSQQAFYQVFCELVQQTIKENELNKNLFEYLHQEAIPSLNTEIHFWQLPFTMLNVLHKYGCSPNCESYTDDAYLDLQNGTFIETLLPLKSIAEKDSSSIIFQILTQGITHLPKDKNLRLKVIEELLRYFQYHVSEHFELRSRSILSEVLSA
jgi:DNA repair protein RecO (recombination protein O)